MWAGGCRWATAAAGRLLLLLLLLALLQAPPAVQPSERFLGCAGPSNNDLEIVGSVAFPVKVYVKLNHNSPPILCLTNHLQNVEVIDPIFQWYGPAGSLSSENSNVEIAPTGTLILKHFNLSGAYNCSIVYKLTAMQLHRKHIIQYLIYAYSDPKIYYEFTVQYHAAPCNSSQNASFKKALLQLLKKLVAIVSCEVKLIKSECHHVKTQRGSLQNEIFFTFSVAPLHRGKHKCQQKACAASHRLNKAKHFIKKFFKRQVKVSRTCSAPLPDIYYIDGTLKFISIDRCHPGYGINAVLHPDCPECCVVCNPGSYNPSEGMHCLPCNSSLIYGATKC
ncbi:zona pellucida-binding protein 1 isoform X2 [Columba livia]|uniref:zona pellucida-binding protein 1 isoform X2 n=1 Tax=Columba livia TaxID=8932 RepID=UPI0031BAD112